jgi:hypothetical protein
VFSLKTVISEQWSVLSDYGVEFDFDAPVGVEQSRDNDHGGGGADGAKELAVDAADGFPVCSVGEVHAGADDIFEGCAGIGEGFFGDGENAAGLAGGVFVVSTYGTGSGYMDRVTYANGAGEPDDGFEGGSAWNIFAHDGFGFIPSLTFFQRR